MGGKSGIWAWIFGLLVAVVVATSRAFGRPWSWDFDRFSLVFLLVAICLAIAAWSFRWMRYGTEGVKQRWSDFDRGVAAEFSNRPKMRRYLILWITVAIALVAYFHMTQQH